MTAAQSRLGTSSDLPFRPKDAAEITTKDGSVFDLVDTYHRLLSSDPDLSMPVAAIEALIELLSHLTTSTTMELLSVVDAQISRLKASVANPIPPTAGAELFRRILLKTLRQETDDGSLGGVGPTRLASATKMSFEDMRVYLVRNSKNFAAQAKAARTAIADVGARYVAPGSTVLTTGGSRCVKKMLLRAAERRTRLHGCPDFRVIYAMDGSHDSEPAVAALRAAGVEVATIDLAATAHALKLGKVERVFVGAEAVCQRGGVMSRMGTYQLALLARQLKKDVYVVTETHKFAMALPLDQVDLPRLGVKQSILNFQKGRPGEDPSYFAAAESQWQADYTPPELVTAFITEQGVKTPSSILEFLLTIYAS
ncbi:unnamed protein product [Discula destructiva]